MKIVLVQCYVSILSWIYFVSDEVASYFTRFHSRLEIKCICVLSYPLRDESQLNNI
jgi:hypothetical protein